MDRKKLRTMLVLAVCGYGVGWYFLDRFERIVLGACVVLALIYGIRLILRDDTRVVIDERGVFDSRLGYGVILWRDITRVYVTNYQNIGHVCMELVNPEHYLKRRSAVMKLLMKFHEKANKVSPFNINTGALDVSTHEVHAAILDGWSFYRD